MPDLALDIIATRTVWEEGAEGEHIPITINICRPIIDKDVKGLWECMHQIVGNGDDVRRRGYGVDSIEALYNSLIMAGIKLRSIIYKTPHEENEYGMWNKGNNFGFPQHPKDIDVDTDFTEDDEDDNR